MSDFNQRRSIVMQALVVLVGVIIVLRLFSLQVLGLGGFIDLADNQAVKRKVIQPERGLLIDRNNKTILSNKMFYDIRFQPQKLKRVKNFDTARFCRLINVDRQHFDTTTYQKIMLNGWNRNITLFKNLKPEDVARLQEGINDFPGIDLIERPQRTYPYSVGAPFIGYINEVTREMLDNPKYSYYKRGDLLGIAGLEKSYEEELRGIPGVKFLLQDVKQRVVGSYKDGALDSTATAGKNLNLHLDIKLQKLAEKMMANKLGSAIAIEPKTGGILAFVSSPTYDPNLLTGNERSANFSKILNSATKPLFNRAVQASYPPGSTFKPVTALVGLDMGVISAGYGYPCRGGYYACGKRIGCTHSGGGHAADLRRAIAHSCNAYFCHVFRLCVDSPANKSVRLGVKRWRNYMSDFGLGHPIGVDLPIELGGNIPSVAYFDRMYNEKWNSCNMSILGMGQGELLLTPLQMANAMCIIANRGYYKIPHFVKAIDGDSTHEKLKPYLEKKVVAKIANNDFEAVITGMQGVIEYGTARGAKIRGIEVCGKTGTVENYTRLNGKKIKLRNHSVFVAFAPKDDPKIAVAVIVENSGYGAQWAGPVASLMMERFLMDTIGKRRQYLVNRMARARLIPRITYIKDSIEKKARRERYKLWKDSVKRSNKINANKKENSNKSKTKKKKSWWKVWGFVEPKNKTNEYYQS
jgi:penicillin-binding protein 2